MTGPAEDLSATPPVSRRSRWRPGIQTLILLVAATAVWMGVVVNRQETDRLETRIRRVSPVVRALIVEDPTKIAVVQLTDLWMDEPRWDVHLPEGQYRVCLATCALGGGMPQAVKAATIAKGRHRLSGQESREGDHWRVSVFCDGEELLAVEEPKDWESSSGSSSSVIGDETVQQPADQPLELLRQLFCDDAGKNSGNGVQIWVEKLSGSQP